MNNELLLRRSFQRETIKKLNLHTENRVTCSVRIFSDICTLTTSGSLHFFDEVH